ncbi:hypothetical protein PTKU46_97770 [Paraburkholderia terrae]|uniref:hypothetical protein n=1 Tax=Paraburkholderia terrae TaxID=311230 RepID=UPI0030E0E348
MTNGVVVGRGSANFCHWTTIATDPERAIAAACANAEDADVWRWFTLLMQDRWFVSVDNQHVATESSFD